MKVLIIEDEKAAAENLKFLLSEIDNSIQVVGFVESVKEAIAYFKNGSSVELIFMDVHLADGISFEIFEKVDVQIPIIFTTAYDEYAVKAFKVNSVDYLLKPIHEDELKEAIEKFKTKQTVFSVTNRIQEVLQGLNAEKRTFKSTYLVRNRDVLIPLPVRDVAYFFVDTGLVKAVTVDRKSFILDKKLEDIENQLDPELFFRVNRQFIVQRGTIESLQHYFNGKLILNMNPKPGHRIIVSKARAPKLKKWINDIYE